MTDVSHAAGVSRRRFHRAERFEFRVLLAVTYPLFLVAAVAQRFGLAADGGAEGARRSVFADAHETAVATLPYAFMG